MADNGPAINSDGMIGYDLVESSANKIGDYPPLPEYAGGYALLLRLPISARIRTGRLGEFYYPAGDYVYLGSARGPGGLRARLERHLRAGKKTHWHIDYLRAYVRVYGYHYLASSDLTRQPLSPPLECCWSQTIARLPGAAIPVIGFGASDCRSGCQSHLIAFELGWFSTHLGPLEAALRISVLTGVAATHQVSPEVQ